MPESCWIRAGVLCVALLVAAAPRDAGFAWAQSPDSTSPIQLVPRTKAEREQRYQDEHRISLVVQVTNASGKPVNGLTADDFSVLDNQKPQKIVRFREGDQKAFKADVHVVVVLDAINDGGSAVGHVKRDLDKFLSQGAGPLPFPFSLVFVSGAGVFETQPSTDREAIASRLEQLAHHTRDPDCDQENTYERNGMRGSSAGAAGLQSAPGQTQASCMMNHFTASINALRGLLGEKQNVRERTILIWTGRGWPLLGDFGSRSATEGGNYREVLAELNTDFREGQVTLDAVSWGNFETPRNIRKPIMTATASSPQTPNEIAEETMALQVLAGKNGGQIFAKVKNFGDAMAACMADGSDFYVLSFDSAPAAAADEFHSIEVKVDRPGVNVRTAASYYAQP